MRAYPLAVLASLALLAYDYPDTSVRPPSGLRGEWQGTARIVTVELHNRSFPVHIDIHADGRVTGTVGDSTLIDGRFFRHRPSGVSRQERHDLMDYMIKGKLVGAVISAKRVIAPEVFIPLDYDNDKFDGAVHTHKTEIGETKFGILSSEITFNRPR
jgi:hypothetical protein